MDTVMITELITSLGFPIVCVIAMGWFIWTIYKRSEQREDELRQEIRESQQTNAKAIETIALYAEKLEVIQQDIHDIKEDISVIMTK